MAREAATKVEVVRTSAPMHPATTANRFFARTLIFAAAVVVVVVVMMLALLLLLFSSPLPLLLLLPLLQLLGGGVVLYLDLDVVVFAVVVACFGAGAVSYTHLTLPTNREV